MSRRAYASKAAMTRALRAALEAGLKVGEFEIETEGDRVRILTHPASAAPSSADQDEKAWAGALAKWRRSA